MQNFAYRSDDALLLLPESASFLPAHALEQLEAHVGLVDRLRRRGYRFVRFLRLDRAQLHRVEGGA